MIRRIIVFVMLALPAMAVAQVDDAIEQWWKTEGRTQMCRN